MTQAEIFRIIDRHYADNPELRDILVRHSEGVSVLAREIARRHRLPIRPDIIHAAAMLHDIGIVATDAPGIKCHGTLPYICHGLEGARMLAEDGVDSIYQRVAERHTGAGLTAEDIGRAHLPLPAIDLVPQTLLERLICYADKFYSKTRPDRRKTTGEALRSLARFGAPTVQRFLELHRRFG